MVVAAVPAGCSSSPPASTRPIAVAPGVDEEVPRKRKPASLPKGGGVYKVGNPYTIKGRLYVPQEDPHYDEIGTASWYGAAFHGRRTANGETFDMNALTAGHPTLPMPSYVYVTNLGNGRTLLLRVNDRGPYVNNRIIDLSARAAVELGFSKVGLARVRVRYAGRAPLNGDDSAENQYLVAQSWHSSRTRVASLSGIDSLLGSLGWSVVNYRQRINGSDNFVRRSSLLGNETQIEVGPFATRSEAERMCHDLSEFGPTKVEPDSRGPEPVFQVQAGPFSDLTTQRVAEWIASAGVDSQ